MGLSTPGLAPCCAAVWSSSFIILSQVGQAAGVAHSWPYLEHERGEGAMVNGNNKLNLNSLLQRTSTSPETW